MASSKRPDIDKFEYSDAPQRSPEWVQIRVGKPSASNLYRWMAVSKRDGKPLQARKDYEAELAFECAFNVAFTRFVTGAMEAGQIMEEFLKRQYEQNNAGNERIKRRYFTYMKEARRQSEDSVDNAAAAIARFEAYTGQRDFKAFRVEQAVGFKRCTGGDQIADCICKSRTGSNFDRPI